MKPFNKVNTTKYTNKKRKEQRLQYLTLGFSCFAMIVSIMFFALAKIEGNKEYKYIDNNYGEHYVGDNIVGAYVDGVKSKNIPGKDGGYYLQKVECDNDAVGTWDNINWEITISNATGPTKCYVYFTTSIALADGTGAYSTTLKNYPIGSIYISVDSANPSTVFGGTWQSFGTGRTIVGVDTSQTEFNTVSKTGGEKTHKLTISEMPSHDHAANPLPITSAGRSTSATDFFSMRGVNRSVWLEGYDSTEKTSKTGGDGSHNNLQPYITVYMWKRTA